LIVPAAATNHIDAGTVPFHEIFAPSNIRRMLEGAGGKVAALAG
jgi:hypothetical protein